MAHPPRILTVLAAVTTLATAALLGLPGAAALASGRASLSMTSTHPATVHGRGFPARARVRVVLSSAGTVHARTVRVAGDGSFTVTFTAPLRPCPGWSVTATTAGRRAVRLHSPHAMCAPPGTA